ncbi:hypothetical protein [Streptomyces lydicus]|uniref:hypothetical protein n=1 Tax=Streptomyces lydicus TaxID=47763 RepID=UPI000B16DEE4|nr:hypothetical protein [Streptomyces lydicus]
MPSTATETKPPTPTTTPEAIKQQPKPAAQTREPASAPGQTLGGVLIPGGALTGLIGFCWLCHQFSLPAVLLAVVACSAVATATLAVRAGRRIRRAGSGRLGRASLRAPGTGHRGGAASGPAGRASTAGGRVPAARSGAGPSQRKPTSGTPSAVGRAGGTSRKPGGLAPKPKPLGAATPNLSSHQPGVLGRNAAALGGPGRRTTPSGAAPRTAPKPTGGASLRKHTGGGAAPTLSGAAGRLARTFSRKSPTTAAGINTPQGGARRTGGAKQPKSSGRQQPGNSKGSYKPAPQQSTTSAGGRARKAAKALTQAALRNRGQSGKQPNSGKLKTRPKRTSRQEKSKLRGAWRGLRHGSRLTKQGSYWVGRKLRKHLSPVTRDRLRKAATPLRATARLVARHGSPLLAHAWRYGSRALLNGHLALGSVRFSTVGPNWLRPLARVFHTLTTPAARALAWAGSWGWLNRWMYRHTSADTTPPKTRRTTPTGVRTAGAHRAVHSPTRITTPATNGVPVSSIEPALPLQYAADAVRTAGAMMVLNPAGNMVGYEATINSLAEIQRAIGDVIAMAAHSSRESFKVNAAIPEAYDDTAVYAHALAGRLDSIPTLYRIIHAEQIDNIENPTIQGAKWDQSANWQ